MVWPADSRRVTPELYDQISRLAAERNMGITVHISEVADDLEYARTQGFRSHTEFAQAHGLLGPRSVLAHFVWSDEEDWKIIASTRTHISHNPASNAKLASGIAPVQGMLKAGVNVSLGCDGGPSNNAYDLVRDMRFVGYLAKLKGNDPMVVPAETVLEMATISGAKAMGLENQVGSIEVGKRADFIMINMDAPHLTPAPDPISTIVYAANGADVDTVVIDGRIVMRDRKVLTLDEGAILEEARKRFPIVARRGGLDIRPRWPVI